MYKLRYNSRWPPYFIWLRNVLKEDEIYTQNQYPASKLILILCILKTEELTSLLSNLLFIFIFVYGNQDMVHGKIATCNTKAMEDAFFVKGSGAPNERMFPNTLEVTRMVFSTL